MIKKILFVFLCAGLIQSCQTEKKSFKGVFFGGQIINPSSRKVTLYQGNKSLDVFELDENLRFV